MSILGWIILGALWVALSILSCNALDNHCKKKYMLIINKEVHYFEYYQDALDYIKVKEVDSEIEYQLYIKDNGVYVFDMGKFKD